MPPKTIKTIKIKTPKTPKLVLKHVTGAYPLMLVTSIYDNGTTKYHVVDGRLPEESRTETEVSVDVFDRLCSSAQAEALENIARFIHQALHGEGSKEVDGEIVFDSKELS